MGVDETVQKNPVDKMGVDEMYLQHVMITIPHVDLELLFAVWDKASHLRT